MQVEELEITARTKMKQWREDWCQFAREVFGVYLDKEQEAIIYSVQHNKMTSVASGTARGKDFCAAVAALCFFYLTPKWNTKGEMVENTRVILSAPTDRQVGNIMVPEFSRLFNRAKNRGIDLPGRLTGYDIRTDFKEWYLTGFKSDDTNMEAWSGLHAANILFCLTEASGISETIFNAIEGNLQGNGRILIVFNPNISSGYAASSQRSPRWKKFRLDSLNAPNVLEKKMIIPGQVDYEWVADKVKLWCSAVHETEKSEAEGDFLWEGKYYRPNDLFRVKVRGMSPKVSQGALIPAEWVEAANERWKEQQEQGWKINKPLRLGVDVAGMGRDSSGFCFRFGHYVPKWEMVQSGGIANHMQIAGKTKHIISSNTDRYAGTTAQAFLDTIGEGAGTYSRLIELSGEAENSYMEGRIHSVKFSEAAKHEGRDLKDLTDQYSFYNMRAYLFWAVRDWLNPDNKTNAMLPPDEEFLQEATEIQWWFRSDGKVQIEAKEDIKKRIGRSPDKFDALANTFYPAEDVNPNPEEKQNLVNYFF